MHQNQVNQNGKSRYDNKIEDSKQKKKNYGIDILALKKALRRHGLQK